MSSSTAPRVPAILRARARANNSRLAQLKPTLHDAILTAPIFLCSTHGLYELDDTSAPCIVPDNTFIFEAQTIGDLTLTTIDMYIWNLLQGPYRESFFQYLCGRDNDTWFKTNGIAAVPEYRNAVSNLTLYKPGDTIYKRTLSIGGGRTTSLKASQRREYKDMGFFRFDPCDPLYPFQGYGSREPYEILQRMHSELVENELCETTDCDLVHSILFSRNRPLKYVGGSVSEQDFRTALPSDFSKESPTIFVFSSCAAISNPTTSAHEARWDAIATLQRQRELETMTMGLMGLGTSGSNSSNGTIPEPMILRNKSRPPALFIPSSRVKLPFSASSNFLYRIFAGMCSGRPHRNAYTRKRQRTRCRSTRRRR
jgi:hypothetical protein